jgi:hypothetical protein
MKTLRYEKKEPVVGTGHDNNKRRFGGDSNRVPVVFGDSVCQRDRPNKTFAGCSIIGASPEVS